VHISIILLARNECENQYCVKWKEACNYGINKIIKHQKKQKTTKNKEKAILPQMPWPLHAGLPPGQSTKVPTLAQYYYIY
jgi:hypothetical protein